MIIILHYNRIGTFKSGISAKYKTKYPINVYHSAKRNCEYCILSRIIHSGANLITRHPLYAKSICVMAKFNHGFQVDSPSRVQSRFVSRPRQRRSRPGRSDRATCVAPSLQHRSSVYRVRVLQLDHRDADTCPRGTDCS